MTGGAGEQMVGVQTKQSRVSLNVMQRLQDIRKIVKSNKKQYARLVNVKSCINLDKIDKDRKHQKRQHKRISQSSVLKTNSTAPIDSGRKWVDS